MRIISLGGFAVFAQVDRVAARAQSRFIFLSSFTSRSFSFYLSACLYLYLYLSSVSA